MSEGFRSYPKNFLIAGLFLTAVISFAVVLASNYDHDESFVKSDMINFTGMEQQIEKTNQNAEAWGKAFKSDNSWVTAGALVIFAIWGVGKLMWGSIVTILDIFLFGLSDVLGVPPVVIGTITALVTISLIFYFWRILKSGE